MSSGIVVGIDPSLTSTGVAVLDNGTPVRLNCFGRACPDGAKFPQRADRMTYTLSAVLQAVPRDAELIGIEGLSYASTDKYIDTETIGLWWHFMTHLHARGVPIVVVPPQTLKVWALGKAPAGGTAQARKEAKQAMIDAAAQNFPDVHVSKSDHADALHLASLCAARLGHQLPFPKERRHKYNIDAVSWPDGLPPIPWCPDCNHPRSDTQEHACMAIVMRKGRREWCGCTTLVDQMNNPTWTDHPAKTAATQES